jgi:hypothetical protein
MVKSKAQSAGAFAPLTVLVTLSSAGSAVLVTTHFAVPPGGGCTEFPPSGQLIFPGE